MALTFAARVSLAQDAPPPSPPVPSAPSNPPESPPPEAPPSATPAPAAPPDAPAPSAPAPAEPPAAPPAVPAPTPGASPTVGSAAFELPPAAAPAPRSPGSKPSPLAAPPRAAAPSDSTTPNPSLPSADSSPAPDANDAKDSDDSNGVFGPFRIGVLVGGGLPDLLSLGGAIKLTRYFGAGINVGLIPTVKLSFYGDATLSFQEYDAYGHIFPFGGAFFLGAGVGYATVRGTLANQTDLSMYHQTNAAIPASVEITSQASVRTLVLTPQLGLLHTFKAGFTIGADLGAQVPIAPSQVDFTTQMPASIPAAFRTTIQTNYIDPNDAKVRSTLDKIGRTPIPTFGIKIGWLL